MGLAAIQLAKGEGPTAIATTRTSKKRDELLSIGADHAIATGEEDLPKRVAEITGGKGARVVFDPVAGPHIETLAAAAALRGIIFECGNPPKIPETATQYIYDRLQDDRLRPKIAKTFPFAQSADAYRYLESNEQIGKVVITV